MHKLNYVTLLLHFELWKTDFEDEQQKYAKKK